MSVTLEQAQGQLEAWLAASTAAAGGQSYEISTPTGTRKLTQVDAAEIRKQIDYWQGWVNRLSRPARGRIRYVVPE